MEVARKAREALQAVHKAGLLHRDISPRNFFIADRGCTSGEDSPDVFVLDFGFSRPVQFQDECADEMRKLEDIFRQIDAD